MMDCDWPILLDFQLYRNDRLRCTVDIRIMGTHYARAEVFIFWHRYTKIGSRRLAA